MNGDFYPGLTVDQVRTAIIVATGLRPEKLGLRLTVAGGGVTVTALRGVPSNLRQKVSEALRDIALAAPTTDYGSWADYTGGYRRLAHTVEAHVGDSVDLYDVAGLIRAYRAAISEALPLGVILSEDDRFYGPFPVDEDLKAGIHDAISDVESRRNMHALFKEHELNLG